MESFKSIFPGIAKKISDSGYFSKKDYDTIRFLRFEEIYFRENLPNLCVLIGYERGLEIWDVSLDPLLIFSKRNQGVSLLSYIPGSLSVNIAIVPLYDTSDFPQCSFQVFSILSNSIVAHVRTSETIRSISSNSLVIALGLLTKIEIYESTAFTKKYCINVANNELKFTLSGWYIAYSIADNQETIENYANFSDTIAKTVHNLAEAGLTTIKTYLDSGPGTIYGKVWVKHILQGSVLCEIQAFTSAISSIHFSKSSHFLIVSPISGFTFHVYRINPAKEIKSDYKNRFLLLYKLHRGVTAAEINDITISDNEKIIVVSSARGTCHIFKINPESTSLSYNHEVLTRIKLGSFLDKQVYPRCTIVLSLKMQAKLKGNLQSAVLEQSPSEIITITSTGMLSRHTIEQVPCLLLSNSLLRNKKFKEIPAHVPSPVVKKIKENEIECVNFGYPGWVPLIRAPQFSVFTSYERFQESIGKNMEIHPLTDKSMPGFTVVYENASRLLEAMEADIPSTQIIPQELDCQFLDKSEPTFKAYLTEKFSK